MSGVASTGERELVFSRLFDAPREAVWRAWTEGERLAKWWGPRGWSTTTHSIEVRPGGQWRYVMHGPDGAAFDNLITYQEILPPERLTYAHGSGIENDPDEFHVTVTFSEEGSGTRLEMRMLFPSAAARAEAESYAADGANSTLERLAEHLAATP